MYGRKILFVNNTRVEQERYYFIRIDFNYVEGTVSGGPASASAAEFRTTRVEEAGEFDILPGNKGTLHDANRRDCVCVY